VQVDIRLLELADDTAFMNNNFICLDEGDIVLPETVLVPVEYDISQYTTLDALLRLSVLFIIFLLHTDSPLRKQGPLDNWSPRDIALFEAGNTRLHYLFCLLCLYSYSMREQAFVSTAKTLLRFPDW
jgi:hypothetical protein